ncbi:MAG: hypothetical protein KF760_32845 [Candidatus Eremiobacteraeota bacterium]|nr:hypothetical protein [Candidatus Eremiobacteraeota bacterium]MCW5868537.1 hypothetical protein [Candidatus Eremiobacteraeota bacterium]
MDLALYLEQLAQEGSRDSQGSFSIDYAKALEKLSQRLFRDPTSWLIKLVQAAAASGARELLVRPLRDRLEVQFNATGFTSSQFQDLQTLLHQPLGSEEQPALAHFLRAFHASRSARAESVAWGAVDAQGGFSYLVRGQEIQRQSMPGRSGKGCDCLLALKPVTPAAWLEEERVLTGRCALSPLTVRWGRRQLNPAVPQVGKHVLLDRLYLSRRPAAELLHLPHLTRVPGLVYDLGNGYKDHYSYGSTLLHQWRSYKSSPDHKLWEAEPSPDFPILESDVIQEVFGIPKAAYAINHGLIRGGRLGGRNNGYQILYVTGLDHFALAELPVAQGRFGLRRPLCARAWLRCPVQPQGESQLVVQQDGVLLDPLPVRLGLAGARAFVSDNTVQTDLSGLVPVRDERVEKLETWLLAETVRSRKELRKALRWGSKYGYSEAAVAQITRLHSLDQE